MPGWSLWLLPPKASHMRYQLDRQISEFVRQIYSDVQPMSELPVFPAHVTLTSLIPPLSEGQDPQEWLDGLEIGDLGGAAKAGEGGGAGEEAKDGVVEVKFKELASGDTFTKRLFIRCEKTASLVGLAKAARRYGVHGNVTRAGEEGERKNQWVDAEEDVEKWAEEHYDAHVSLLYANLDPTGNRMTYVNDGLRKMGIMMSGEEPQGMAWMDGWRGGRLWLVPTDKEIKDWKPIAERVLKS